MEPYAGHCPECTALADINEADPPSWRLREILGDVVARLGEVQVRRRGLPGRGQLYLTTTGLFFMPLTLNETGVHPDRTRNWDRALLWTTAGVLWAPLSLLMMILDLGFQRQQGAPGAPAPKLTPEQSEMMPQLLMDHPGTFFISCEMIRSIGRRFGGWVIQRNTGGKVSLRPLNASDGFHVRMSQLVESSPWRHAVM